MAEDEQLQLNNVENIIKQRIFIIRGHKVMIDVHLAELYGVETKVFNQAVKRNSVRFPEDFRFKINEEEFKELNRSQIVTGSQKHRDPRFLPYAFTEHGVAMLSAVLKSELAIQMSIFIVRAFIKMRESLDQYKDLSIKINKIESKQKEQGNLLATVHSVVKHLIEKPVRPKGKIGFADKT